MHKVIFSVLGLLCISRINVLRYYQHILLLCMFIELFLHAFCEQPFLGWPQYENFLTCLLQWESQHWMSTQASNTASALPSPTVLKWALTFPSRDLQHWDTLSPKSWPIPLLCGLNGQTLVSNLCTHKAGIQETALIWHLPGCYAPCIFHHGFS